MKTVLVRCTRYCFRWIEFGKGLIVKINLCSCFKQECVGLIDGVASPPEGIYSAWSSGFRREVRKVFAYFSGTNVKIEGKWCFGGYRVGLASFCLLFLGKASAWLARIFPCRMLSRDFPEKRQMRQRFARARRFHTTRKLERENSRPTCATMHNVLVPSCFPHLILHRWTSGGKWNSEDKERKKSPERKFDFLPAAA